MSDFVEASHKTPAGGVQLSSVPPGNDDYLPESCSKNAAALRILLNTVYTRSADADAAFAAIGEYTRINGDNVYRSLPEYRFMPLVFWTNEVLLSAVTAQVLYSALHQEPPQNPPHQTRIKKSRSHTL